MQLKTKVQEQPVVEPTPVTEPTTDLDQQYSDLDLLDYQPTPQQLEEIPGIFLKPDFDQLTDEQRDAQLDNYLRMRYDPALGI
jgi:hypothetical protein